MECGIFLFDLFTILCANLHILDSFALFQQQNIQDRKILLSFLWNSDPLVIFSFLKKVLVVLNNYGLRIKAVLVIANGLLLCIFTCWRFEVDNNFCMSTHSLFMPLEKAPRMLWAEMSWRDITGLFNVHANPPYYIRTYYSSLILFFF